MKKPRIVAGLFALAVLAACSPPPPPPPSFTISVSPPSVNLLPGASANLTVTVTRNETFKSAVTVSLAAPPAGVVAGAVNIPASATTGTLTVQNINAAAGTTATITVVGASGETTANANLSFSSDPIPVISSVAPSAALNGETITLTGSGFVAGATAKVGSVPATINVTNATSATVTIPAGVRGPQTVSVTAPAGTDTSTASVFVGKVLTLDASPSTEDIRQEMIKLPDGSALQLPAATYVKDANPLIVLNRALYGAGDTTIIRGDALFFAQGDVPMEISGIKFEDASPNYQFGSGGANTTLRRQATANGTVVMKNVKLLRTTPNTGTAVSAPQATNIIFQDSTVQIGTFNLTTFGNLEFVNSTVQADTAIALVSQGGSIRVEGGSLIGADTVTLQAVFGDLEITGKTPTTGATIRATDGGVNLITPAAGRMTVKYSTLEAKQDIARAGGGTPDLGFTAGGRVTLDANVLIKAESNIVVSLAGAPPPVPGATSGADVFITNNQQITADGVAGGTFTGTMQLVAPAGSLTVTGNQKLESDGPIALVSQFGDVTVTGNPNIRSASGGIQVQAQGTVLTSPPALNSSDLAFNNNALTVASASQFAAAPGTLEMKNNTITSSSTNPGQIQVAAQFSKRVTIQGNTVNMTDTDLNSPTAFVVQSQSAPNPIPGVTLDKTVLTFSNNTFNVQGAPGGSTGVGLQGTWMDATVASNTITTNGVAILAAVGSPSKLNANNNTFSLGGGQFTIQVSGGTATDKSSLTFATNTVSKASVTVGVGNADNTVSVTGNTITDVPTNGTGLLLVGSGTLTSNTISALAGSTNTRGIAVNGGSAAITVNATLNKASGFTRAVYFLAGSANGNSVTFSQNDFATNAATNFIELDGWTAAKGVINAATGNTWPGAVTPPGTNVVLTNGAAIAGISL